MSGRSPQGNVVNIGNSVSIEQKKRTVGHLRRIPVAFDVPVGETRYFDMVVPDLTNGWDIMGAHFLLKGATPGDKVKDVKLMVRPLTSTVVSEAALIGATTVKIKGPRAVVESTKKKGALDEGYSLSFGTDNTTASGINAATDTQLPEYEIKRLGESTPLGGGLFEQTVELFTGLAADIAVDDEVNLVGGYVQQGGAIEVVEGEVFDLGMETLMGQNLPAGATVRMAYENTGGALYRVRGSISVMY